MTRVAVLYGGASAERDVSLKSGKACAAALYERGFDVQLIDVGRDVGELVKELTPPPDVVFNALHGRFGEDGTVQGVLDLMGIKYTHSGLLASALAMDKAMAKKVFAQAGIRTVEGMVMTREAILATGDPMPRPYVVKPVAEGSSVGVCIVEEGANTLPFAEEDWPFGDEVMVERFVPGRELTVAVMEDRALAVTEIAPKGGFYDYKHKYTGGVTDHIIPARVDPQIYDEAMRLSVKAHRALGCRGVSRADFRYDDTGGEPGVLYLLEVNTQPGMTDLSLVPEQANHAGIDFGELVEWMVQEAACNG
ncbi:D-alanine--D-alanine ligase [Ferruginivarius sediminum]|uniref:D-alanine--D-alanine ligase n=1 Tax=Ferruginivarius sediminum TaxID=2661937 RepID=A0A369T9W6_9PROT|nr:D-alanine--D-alanine ligase [Ferruginivarius sediminum]RDD61294.1 D-alanine--D-alanine ligase [Ferruginivarius sediminum]